MGLDPIATSSAAKLQLCSKSTALSIDGGRFGGASCISPVECGDLCTAIPSVSLIQGASLLTIALSVKSDGPCHAKVNSKNRPKTDLAAGDTTVGSGPGSPKSRRALFRDRFRGGLRLRHRLVLFRRVSFVAHDTRGKPLDIFGRCLLRMRHQSRGAFYEIIFRLLLFGHGRLPSGDGMGTQCRYGELLFGVCRVGDV